MRDNGPNPARHITKVHSTPTKSLSSPIQPISGLRSLCTNTTSCALQPFKIGPAALRADQTTENPDRRAMASTTHPSRSVRRSLFGPVDHEQLRRELRQRLKEMSEQDSRRWNFNFQTDTPLDGRFQWEEVPLDSAAALYQESADRPGATAVCPAGTGTDTEDRLSAADQENCSSISNTRLRPAEETPVRRKRARSRSVDKSGGKCARITGEERVTACRTQ